MTYYINGAKVERLTFKHLDYYDILAEFQRRNEATDETAPWCYVRRGSEVTLCTLLIDGVKVEGWSHKVPQDGPRRAVGNHNALKRALLASGKDKAWRKDFWETYHAGQEWMREEQRKQQGIRLIKGVSIGGNSDTSKAETEAAPQGEGDVRNNSEAVGSGSVGEVSAVGGDGSSGAVATV